MFQKNWIIKPNEKANYDDIICKTGCKSPSRILSSKITFTEPLYKEKLENKLNKKGDISNQKNYCKFIQSELFTNNHCTDNKIDCILPCNDSNCITKNIFNIMILCCNLVYSLINQTRVNIHDYFYNTNLIEELCIVYTLLKYQGTFIEVDYYNDNIDTNKLIKDTKKQYKLIKKIIKQFYSLMNKINEKFCIYGSDNNINNFVKTNLSFLNTNLLSFINDSTTIDSIKISSNDTDYININKLLNKLIESLNKLKELNNDTNMFNKQKLKELYSNIQKVTVNDYINYFEEAYKIIKKILKKDFNSFYKNVYKYNYNNNVIELMKLRTYLLLMFIYKIRFLSLDDVDDKGGRQAEFFISNVLRDFYNYYYIDNKFNGVDADNVKKEYKNILIKLLQYNFYTEKKIYNNISIFANDNIIILEYYNDNVIELFRPFEKMYNINECSYNKIINNNGKIGGDLIYLHECYSKNNYTNKFNLNNNSICIIVDSKAYQDSKFMTDFIIEKTIIQCYLYAQYVKKCYNNRIFNDNLYLSVVNPIYGSYYVYKYNYIKDNFMKSGITNINNNYTTIDNYLIKNNYNLLGPHNYTKANYLIKNHFRSKRQKKINEDDEDYIDEDDEDYIDDED